MQRMMNISMPECCRIFTLNFPSGTHPALIQEVPLCFPKSPEMPVLNATITPAIS